MDKSLPVKMIPLPTPFAVGDINSYLFTADPLTIVDPGLYYRPSREVLEKTLKESGLELSEIKRVVVTHGHPDHYGMAGLIQKKSGAGVLVRDEEVSKIKPDQGELELIVKTLKTTGMTEEVIKLNWSIVFGGNVPYTHPLENITTYSGEPDLEFSGFKIRLIHLPGHSGGHTCLFWEEEKVLLSGDLLLPEITAVPSIEYDSGQKNLRRRGLSEIMESMERIRTLSPSLCLPGHGGPITDPAELAGSRIDFHRSRLDEIFSLVPREDEGGITPYSLSRLYYPHVEGFDKFLAVIEVVSHLDRLADEGRITERMDEMGVSRFYRP